MYSLDGDVTALTSLGFRYRTILRSPATTWCADYRTHITSPSHFLIPICFVLIYTSIIKNINVNYNSTGKGNRTSVSVCVNPSLAKDSQATRYSRELVINVSQPRPLSVTWSWASQRLSVGITRARGKASGALREAATLIRTWRKEEEGSNATFHETEPRTASSRDDRSSCTPSSTTHFVTSLSSVNYRLPLQYWRSLWQGTDSATPPPLCPPVSCSNDPHCTCIPGYRGGLWWKYFLKMTSGDK